MRKITTRFEPLNTPASLGFFPFSCEIPESKVQEFCKECDKNGEDGICNLGENSQAIYVAGGRCRWAIVNGQKGNMTEEGFKPKGLKA